MSASRLGLLVCALALSAEASAERAAPAGPYVAAEGSARADTLRYEVRAGDALIVGLPARVGGGEATYDLVDAPALSWLVDRSFVWQTLTQERGTLAVRVRRTVAGRAPDEVVLLVQITP